jgi:hypothetical protein
VISFICVDKVVLSGGSGRRDKELDDLYEVRTNILNKRVSNVMNSLKTLERLGRRRRRRRRLKVVFFIITINR